VIAGAQQLYEVLSMMHDRRKGFLLAISLMLAACETIESNVLEKSAREDELRKETTEGVQLPPGCPTLNISVPAGQTSITVSYQEPTTDQQGRPLTELAYTTLYMSSQKTHAKAIRVWTNNARGGAQITIRDIPVSAPEMGFCVTASNWARKESSISPPPQ
jgi:hypothetical protein